MSNKNNSDILLGSISHSKRAELRRQHLTTKLQKPKDDIWTELNIDEKSIRDQQLKDPQCRAIIFYLKYGKLPNNNDKARNILLREEDYIILNNILYHIQFKPGNKDTDIAVVVPATLRATLLHHFHDSSLGGHMSFRRTLSAIKQKIFLDRNGQRC